MKGFDRVGLKGAYLCSLTEHEIERIHDGALQILAQTGVLVHNQNVLNLLAEAGCPVSYDERRARIPDQVIETAVSQAPSVVKLYNRLGEQVMALGAGPFFARTSSGATGILDLDNGQRREPTSQDLANAARLADALPHIHGVSIMAVQPADVPVTAVDLHAVKLTLTNTVKPVGYVCLNEQLLELVLDMVALSVGGMEALQQRPIITAIAESTSPLQLVASQLAVLQTFASSALPLTLHAHPIAGLTAPVTLAGELVITHAEILSLATIAQLIRPGTPVVYGMSSSVPDMRTAANLAGAVEIGLLGAAVSQLAQRCGLPSVMSSGIDAHWPDAQATTERLMTLLPPALAGIDLINLSTLETKMSFSLEQLVIDNDILGLVQRYLQGIVVDDETLALDLIDSTEPGGAFITSDHTLRHFQDELLVSDLIVHQPRETWEAAGRPDLLTQAKNKVRRILAEHQPPVLPDRVVVQFDEILKEADGRYLLNM
jgi:trimethylamine--corrinoid protein Co-methyltransferase